MKKRLFNSNLSAIYPFVIIGFLALLIYFICTFFIVSSFYAPCWVLGFFKAGFVLISIITIVIWLFLQNLKAERRQGKFGLITLLTSGIFLIGWISFFILLPIVSCKIISVPGLCNLYSTIMENKIIYILNFYILNLYVQSEFDKALTFFLIAPLIIFAVFLFAMFICNVYKKRIAVRKIKGMGLILLIFIMVYFILYSNYGFGYWEIMNHKYNERHCFQPLPI